MPLKIIKLKTKNDYGLGFLKGEGDAMAQYVKTGQRIPRRGEVGLTEEQIQKYEELGYVMSGDRHKGMNAKRIQKEIAVYNAEEKRTLAELNYERKIKRESKIMTEMQKLLS